MRPEHASHDPLAMLRLQMIAKELEREAIGRYLSYPGNLEAVVQALEVPFPILRALKPPYVAMCPPGWIHTKDCKCVVDVGDTLYKDKDQMDELEEVKRALQSLYHRLAELEGRGRE